MYDRIEFIIVKPIEYFLLKERSKCYNFDV